MKIMVSACLLGENCKYNAQNNKNEKLIEFLKGHEVISVCPEVLGGLSIPRSPVEIVDGIAINKDGTVVDSEFRKGAKICLETAKKEKIDLAILQPRSPSCGVHKIYDGTFCGNLIDGNGITAQILIDNGIKTILPEEIDKI